jgi:hypothetical protein
MLNDPAVLSTARKAAAGEKKGMPVAAEEDEPEIDEVERAAEKKVTAQSTFDANPTR